MSATVDVTAFVDWQNQLYNFNTIRITDCRSQSKKTLDRVCLWIANILEGEAARPVRFRVRIRLYHGWHAGLTPTDRRRALARLAGQLEPVGRVQFSGGVAFGDRLLSALDCRLHRKLRVHLPDTLRNEIRSGEPQEKMVDTAIAADLIADARSAPEDWRLVLSEDDDVVPPLLVAESWSRPSARNLLLRKSQPNPHLILTDLRRELPNELRSTHTR